MRTFMDKLTLTAIQNDDDDEFILQYDTSRRTVQAGQQPEKPWVRDARPDARTVRPVRKKRG